MNYQRFEELISKFAEVKLLVVGDVMVDEFLWGRVNRISPEAPVPVVEVERETFYAGGAANVARNLTEFSRQVAVLGLVGEDAAAVKLRDLLEQSHINSGYLLNDEAFTTVMKTRVIARSQQMVRVDREKRWTLTEKQHARAVELFEKAVQGVDAVIFEDYGKGLLTQELADQLIATARAQGKVICVDPNPRNPIQWRGADVMKPNRQEAFSAVNRVDEGAVTPVTQDAPLMRVGQELLEQWDCRQVLLTLSEHGMMLFTREDAGSPTHARKSQEVFDVSGAGDTVIALYTLALAAGATTSEAVQIATHASCLVVGKIGTATVTPRELLKSLAEDFSPDPEKQASAASSADEELS
jgi:D-beta-D-heptose 7-phosphate kinase/D-beta-D-heptose 1-phosphate adenosyltransferase